MCHANHMALTHAGLSASLEVQCTVGKLGGGRICGQAWRWKDLWASFEVDCANVYHTPPSRTWPNTRLGLYRTCRTWFPSSAEGATTCRWKGQYSIQMGRAALPVRPPSSYYTVMPLLGGRCRDWGQRVTGSSSIVQAPSSRGATQPTVMSAGQRP